MTTLEDALRLAATKGVTHLSIWPVQSQDRKKTYWHAQAAPSTGHSYVTANSTDIVEAVVEVIKALPSAPKRKGPKPKFSEASPPLSEYPQRAAQMAAEAGIELEEQVTAPVSDEPPTLDDWLPKS